MKINIADGFTILIAIFGIIMSFRLGMEYQKIRIQRFWRQNNQKIREMHNISGKEDR